MSHLAMRLWIGLAIGAAGGDDSVDEFAEYKAAIQGVWQETAPTRQHRIAFQGDTMILKVGENDITGKTTARFKISPRDGTIDILRSSGTQLGLYMLEGDVLTLMLARVKDPRPESMEVAAKKQPGNKPQRFVFERVKMSGQP